MAALGASPEASPTHTSVEATGGVYKGQGLSQRRLVTYAYLEFQVHDEEFQASIPTFGLSLRGYRFLSDTVDSFRPVDSSIAARVQPGTSMGIQTCKDSVILC